MRKIVYYVATSLDGYISGLNDDVSGFNFEGAGVKQYLEDLKSFDTVIMGKKTYEFGYKYGMKPGDAPYPHMKHYIFSRTLQLENATEQVQVYAPDLNLIDRLKTEEGSDIYLAGGGEFAGWLLENEKIDILKIKLNPFIQGEGVKLFERTKKIYKSELLDTTLYDLGLQIMTYRVNY